MRLQELCEAETIELVRKDGMQYIVLPEIFFHKEMPGGICNEKMV